MSIPHIIPSKVNFDSFSSDPCDKRMGLFYYIIVKPLTTDMLTIPINIILYHPIIISTFMFQSYNMIADFSLFN